MVVCVFAWQRLSNSGVSFCLSPSSVLPKYIQIPNRIRIPTDTYAEDDKLVLLVHFLFNSDNSFLGLKFDQSLTRTVVNPAEVYGAGTEWRRGYRASVVKLYSKTTFRIKPWSKYPSLLLCKDGCKIQLKRKRRNSSMH